MARLLSRLRGGRPNAPRLYFTPALLSRLRQRAPGPGRRASRARRTVHLVGAAEREEKHASFPSNSLINFL
jgi:hypothetical protein